MILCGLMLYIVRVPYTIHFHIMFPPPPWQSYCYPIIWFHFLMWYCMCSVERPPQGNGSRIQISALHLWEPHGVSLINLTPSRAASLLFTVMNRQVLGTILTNCYDWCPQISAKRNIQRASCSESRMFCLMKKKYLPRWIFHLSLPFDTDLENDLFHVALSGSLLQMSLAFRVRMNRFKVSRSDPRNEHAGFRWERPQPNSNAKTFHFGHWRFLDEHTMVRLFLLLVTTVRKKVSPLVQFCKGRKNCTSCFKEKQ